MVEIAGMFGASVEGELGVLAGVAVAAVSNKMMNGGHRKASQMRKSAGKAMHSVGNLIGDVEKMLR